MDLTKQQKAILAAMDSLPPASSVKRIRETCGITELVAQTMHPLVRADLVALVESQEPPVVRFSLTGKGRTVAAQIRQTEHPKIHTPEMARPIPTEALHRRVSREALAEAISAGRSIGWMCLRFDASRKGLIELANQYGLHIPGTPEPPAATQEGMKQMPKGVKINWPSHTDLLARIEQLKADGQEYVQVLCDEMGIKPKRLYSRIWLANKELGNQPTHGRRNLPPSQPAPACPMCSDSGIHSGDAFELCACPAGRAKAAEFEAMATAKHPAAKPTTEPLTTEAHTEGVSTSATAEAPASPTASETTISATVPTAQQVEAIAADLTGHQPTQAELEAMFTEPGQSSSERPEVRKPAVLMDTWDNATPEKQREMYRVAWAGLLAATDVCCESNATISRLESEVAALTATLEQAAAVATATTFLLVDTDGSTRVLESAEELTPGDEWAETVKTTEGRRLVRVWQCTEVWVLHGTVLCLLVPQGFVLGALPVMQREVA